VEAFTARLLPGTPEDPGAREAGVVNYIDYMLDQNQGLVEATYRSGPYVQVYDVAEGPPADAEEFDVVWVPSDQIERYGYQSILTPADVYQLGLASLDNYSFRKHERHFLRLTEAEQDGVIQDLVDGNADDAFPQFPGTTFFHVLRRHTGEGMFSDPQYGGNRDMVGWNLIGYSGAQRAWTPDEIKMEGMRHPPQALASLAHFTAGEDVGEHVHMPVSGSDIELDSRGTIGNSTP
jgi:gluconate 2-dehydrogenase gamma chain